MPEKPSSHSGIRPASGEANAARWRAPSQSRMRASRGTRISPGGVGRWSARHPWRALLIWVVFVACCVAVGAAAGTSALSNGSVGESARGYAVMNQYGRYGLWGPPREYVYFHSSAQVSSDPGFAAAVGQVERQIAALGLPVRETTSAGRHSALLSVSPGRPMSPAVAGEVGAAPARIQAALAGTDPPRARQPLTTDANRGPRPADRRTP